MKHEGPYTETELKSLWQNGTLTAESFYHKKGTAVWLPVDSNLLKEIANNKSTKLPLWLRVWAIVVLGFALCATAAWVAGNWNSRPVNSGTASAQSERVPHAKSANSPESPSSPPSTTQQELSITEIVRDLRASVGYVRVFDSQNKLKGTGTGWFLSEDGLFVTNHHVVDDDLKIIVKLDDGTLCTAESIYYKDPTADFVILRMDGRGYTPVKLRPVDEPPIEGEEVVVVGNPMGLEGTVSTGIVSGIRKTSPNNTWVQISAPISPGSSGSPVADRRGRVLGMATLTYQGGQALNFAILASDIIQTIKNDPFSKEVTLSDLRAREEDILKTVSRVEEISDLGRSAKNFRSHLNELETALDRYRNDARIVAAVGGAYFQLEMNPEAEDVFVGWRGEDSADIAICYSYLLVDEQRHDEAETQARKAVKIKPDSAPGWLALGFVLENKRQFSDAEQAFRKTVEIDDQSSLAWSSVGRMRFILGDKETAIALFKKSLAISPDANTCRYLYLVQDSVGRYKEATKTCKQYLELNPDDDTGWHYLSRFYFKTNSYKSARKAIDTAIKLNPKDKNHWRLLFLICHDAGDKRGADKAYQKYREYGGD